MFSFRGMARHNELGKIGEDKAVAYLKKEGYIILDRNWHLRHRELDIVCMQEKVLVIVEVKTRLLPEERPEELLDYKKRNNLRRAADAYIKLKGIQAEVRFDLILLTGDHLQIEHIQDAIQVFE